MKLSDGEKVILLMLSELYEKTGVQGEIDPKFIRSAIFSGNTWGINWKLNDIPFENENAPPIVSEVVGILEMWSLIEESYAALTEDVKQLIEKRAAPFGKDPKFIGFDHERENEYIGISRFLIEDLERFAQFKGRTLDSQKPSLDMYRRMLEVFEKVQGEMIGELLEPTQIIEILRVRIEPSNI